MDIQLCRLTNSPPGHPSLPGCVGRSFQRLVAELGAADRGVVQEAGHVAALQPAPCGRGGAYKGWCLPMRGKNWGADVCQQMNKYEMIYNF